MLAAAGLIPLLVLIYARPQEYFEWMQQVPLLYLACAAAVFGLLIDWRLRLSRPAMSPQLPIAVLLVAWIVLGAVFTVPRTEIVGEVVPVLVSFALLATIAHGVDTLRGMRAIGGTLAILCAFLIVVGIHQGLAPRGCILLDQTDFSALQSGKFDGRPCDTGLECYEGPEAAPGGDYACEHVGLFGTTSVRNRVRYRGKLQDPNELALAICCALPLVFALASGQRRAAWKVFAVLATAGTLAILVLTQSRTGQLAFCAVLGVYLLKRFGVKGIIAAAVVALPVMLLGGRSGAEATESVDHRLESWAAGFDMLRSSPVIGVGKGMFAQHNFLTAHNSYLLAASELGLVGFFLWSALIYMSVKTAYAALRRLEDAPAAAHARAWALAILASMVGMLAGMLVLSLSYHHVLWIHLGLCGALHAVVRRHDPAWRVKLRVVDVGVIAALGFGMLAATALYLRLRGY